MPRAKPKTTPSDLQVTRLPLADLTPYPKNPRHITPAAVERRYCQVNGCRGWWVHGPSLGGRPRYCKKCSMERRRKAGREWARDLWWNRVGRRIEGRLSRCEMCCSRPSRLGFSFCLPCSFCCWCGENKPRTKSSRCDRCHKESNKQRIKSRLKKAKQRTKTRKPRKCRWCQKVIPKIEPSYRVLCSKECRDLEGRKYPRKCKGCSKVIHKKGDLRKVWCSPKCQSKARTLSAENRMPRKCKGCPQILPRTANPKKEYCSINCCQRYHWRRKPLRIPHPVGATEVQGREVK